MALVRFALFVKPSTYEALQAVASAMGKTESQVAAEFLAEAEDALRALAKGVEKINKQTRGKVAKRALSLG